MGSREAVGLARRVCEEAVKPIPLETLQNLVRALPALADRLTPEEAAATAELFRRMLDPNGDGPRQEHYAAAVAALAGRLEPTKARAPVRPGRGEVPRGAGPPPGHPPFAQYSALPLAELLPRLEEGEAHQAAATAAALLLEGLAASDLEHERLALARPLAALGRRTGQGRYRARHREGPCRPGPRGQRLARAPGLGGRGGGAGGSARPGGGRARRREAPRRLGREPTRRVAGTLPHHSASAGGSARPSRVGGCIKHPGCVRGAQAVILGRLGRQTGQKFADVWQLIDWLAVNDAGVDILEPTPHAGAAVSPRRSPTPTVRFRPTARAGAADGDTHSSRSRSAHTRRPHHHDLVGPLRVGRPEAARALGDEHAARRTDRCRPPGTIPARSAARERDVTTTWTLPGRSTADAPMSIGRFRARWPDITKRASNSPATVR